LKFADLEVGKRFLLGPLRVEQEEVIDFASRYDDQWFHTDPDAAERGPFQGLIASGWHTCALAMRLVSRDILRGSESFASPGLSHVRWPHPVRPGDELTLEVLVHESRISASRPTLGVVRWQWLMRNGQGALVLDLEATSMFRLAAP
jgi:acyl dehydratase